MTRKQVASQAVEAFPSNTLAIAIFKARYGEATLIDPVDIRAIQREMQYTAAKVVRNISHDVQAELLLSDGNVPTLLFSEGLLLALSINSRKQEDQILDVFFQEFKGLIAGCDRAVPINNMHELVCDPNGNLVLRCRQPKPDPVAISNHA